MLRASLDFRERVGMRDIGVPCRVGAGETLIAMQGLPYMHRKLERSYDRLWSNHFSFLDEKNTAGVVMLP